MMKDYLKEFYELVLVQLAYPTTANDPDFNTVWDTYSSLINDIKEWFVKDNQPEAAEEVRLYFERLKKVSIISEDMPVKIPSQVTQTFGEVKKLLFSDGVERGEMVWLFYSVKLIQVFANYIYSLLGVTAWAILPALNDTEAAGNIMLNNVKRDLSCDPNYLEFTNE